MKRKSKESPLPDAGGEPPKMEEGEWEALIERGEISPRRVRAAEVGEVIGENVDPMLCPVCEQDFHDAVRFKNSEDAGELKRAYSCFRNHQWVFDMKEGRVVSANKGPRKKDSRQGEFIFPE